MERDGDLPRIAVSGAGHVGPVIARVAVDAGYDVTIAASAEPERIALITELLIPGAEPRWAADAAAEADVVVLSIPIHKFAAFDPALVAGQGRGRRDELLAAGRRRSGVVRRSPVRQQRDRSAAPPPVDGRQDPQPDRLPRPGRSTPSCGLG